MRRGLRVGRSRRRDTSVVGRIDGHRQGAAGPPGRAVRRVLVAGRASAVLRKSTHQRSWASAGRAVAGGGARRADELVRGSQARGAPRCRRAASRAGTGCASPGRGRVAATAHWRRGGSRGTRQSSMCAVSGRLLSIGMDRGGAESPRLGVVAVGLGARAVGASGDVGYSPHSIE